ncbi:MAG: hypothetical protein Aurels2KO_34970 [Aureliella sp.]
MFALSTSGADVLAGEWMTWPSTYTHDSTGQRVDQFAEPKPALATVRTDFQRSGMRHYRSSLQAGLSSDNLHIVERWGRQVQPYEQWRFPYRPYGVPYNQWGPQAPYGIINGQFGGGFRPGIGYPYPGYPLGGIPGQGNAGGQGGQAGGGQGGNGQAGNNQGGGQGSGNRPAPGMYPGYGYGPQPGFGRYPNAGNPYAGYPYPPGGYPPNLYPPGGSNGFPLTPPYTGQPWFNGDYPEAPPLRRW